MKEKVIDIKYKLCHEDIRCQWVAAQLRAEKEVPKTFEAFALKYMENKCESNFGPGKLEATVSEPCKCENDDCECNHFMITGKFTII